MAIGGTEEHLLQLISVMNDTEGMAGQVAVYVNRLLQFIVSDGASPKLWPEGFNQLGEDSGPLVEKAIDDVTLRQNGSRKSHGELVKLWGRTSSLPAAFKGALHSANSGLGFREAINQEIMAGGDNASRACLVGALLGARLKIEAIPVEWIEQTGCVKGVLDDVLGILEGRSVEWLLRF